MAFEFDDGNGGVVTPAPLHNVRIGTEVMTQYYSHNYHWDGEKFDLSKSTRRLVGEPKLGRVVEIKTSDPEGKRIQKVSVKIVGERKLLTFFVTGQGNANIVTEVLG